MIKLLRILRLTFLLLLGAVGIFAALNWSMVVQIARFSPIILPAFHGAPETQAEANRQDLRFLGKLKRIDRSFSDEARQDFVRQLDGSLSRTGDMNRADLYLTASRLSALADNGHTGPSVSPLYREFNRLDVKFYWFQDGLYIVRAEKNLKALVGARITSIEGRDVSEVQTRINDYFGGVEQRRRLYGVFMMESPEIMHAAGLAEAPDSLHLSLVDQAGEAQEVTLAGTNAPGQNELPSRHPWMTLKPVSLPDEKDKWHRTLNLAEGELPLNLRDSNRRLFSEPVAGGLYIRTLLTLDSPEKPLATFLGEAIDPYRGDKLDFLVVDLRWNSGGDYTKVLDFAKTAHEAVREDGQIYIVVGPQTFSAAIVSAALIKYYGSDKSMIVGQPMGDREQFWAERGMRLVLPNSKFLINYATGYHDWEKGCEGHKYCFSQNLLHQVPAGSLAPEVLIEPTYESYASGRDEVLDWILSHHE